MTASLNTPLSLSRIHFPVTTLGPGKRIGIWFQGCSLRCPGCISTDTWARVPENATVAEVLAICASFGEAVEGVTITGGEPSEQPAALAVLLQGLSEILPTEADVLVYSGRTFDELTLLMNQLAGLVDALISEPFVEHENQTRPLMGSDNQQLHLLTSLGERRFRPYLRPRDTRDDALDFMADDEGRIWMAGIPRRGDMERLRGLMADEGVWIRTSEQRLQ
jgi:anaerobic ribonucleoside-triphosphate reductase activating protein